MDSMQQGIIMLLKSAITGEKLVLPEDFNIDVAYSCIRTHHMASLIYAGAMNCGVSSDKPTMHRLFQEYCRAVQINARQMQMLEKLFASFEENHIDYLSLKGIIMKSIYPQPELRMMGDADILIREEQYDTIVSLMSTLNFWAKESNALHYVWQSDQLMVELHRSLVPMSAVEHYQYFRDGWRFASERKGMRHSMSPEDAFIFIFAHFARHYLGSGIGCRHVVDLWVYLRRYPEMNKKYIESELEKLHLIQFYRNVRRMIEAWFENGDMDERSAFITEMIFQNGSWGSEKNALLTKWSRSSVETSKFKGIKVSYILYKGGRVLQFAFKSPKELYAQYPSLKKRPYVVPLIWIKRFFEKMFASKTVWKKQKSNMDLLNKANLSERKKALEYVGLATRDENKSER